MMTHSKSSGNGEPTSSSILHEDTPPSRHHQSSLTENEEEEYTSSLEEFHMEQMEQQRGGEPLFSLSRSPLRIACLSTALFPPADATSPNSSNTNNNENPENNLNNDMSPRRPPSVRRISNNENMGRLAIEQGVVILSNTNSNNKSLDPAGPDAYWSSESSGNNSAASGSDFFEQEHVLPPKQPQRNLGKKSNSFRNYFSSRRMPSSSSRQGQVFLVNPSPEDNPDMGIHDDDDDESSLVKGVNVDSVIGGVGVDFGADIGVGVCSDGKDVTTSRLRQSGIATNVDAGDSFAGIADDDDDSLIGDYTMPGRGVFSKSPNTNKDEDDYGGRLFGGPRGGSAGVGAAEVSSFSCLPRFSSAYDDIFARFGLLPDGKSGESSCGASLGQTTHAIAIPASISIAPHVSSPGGRTDKTGSAEDDDDNYAERLSDEEAQPQKVPFRFNCTKSRSQKGQRGRQHRQRGGGAGEGGYQSELTFSNSDETKVDRSSTNKNGSLPSNFLSSKVWGLVRLDVLLIVLVVIIVGSLGAAIVASLLQQQKGQR